MVSNFQQVEEEATMLEHEGWGNPSQMILTNSDEVPVDHHHHHNGIDIFNITTENNSNNNHTNGSASALSLDYSTHHQHHTNINFSNNTFTPQHHFFNNTSSQFHHTPYEPRPFPPSSSYSPFDNIPNNSAPPAPPNGSYFLIPKVEEGSIVSRQIGGTRIGLNLGHRTYFSAQDDDFVNRFYRRSRPGGGGMDGVGGGGMVNSPRCQAEGCAADLSNAKHYHRRHKVCEFHSKAATVIAGGLTQRFCQQCSRFHLLTEFDNGKRSCRKRLADHNLRRRKTPQLPTSSSQSQLEPQKLPVETSSNNLESSAMPHLSSSSVTIGISPPRMTLECFRQGSYREMASSAISSSSVFYSN